MMMVIIFIIFFFFLLLFLTVRLLSKKEKKIWLILFFKAPFMSQLGSSNILSHIYFFLLQTSIPHIYIIFSSKFQQFGKFKSFLQTHTIWCDCDIFCHNINFSISWQNKSTHVKFSNLI